MNSIGQYQTIRGKSILGQLGELMAEEYLRRQGYEILDKNYRTTLGELDLIAKEKDALVFVEVKTRATDELGSPLENVGPAKQKKIKTMAAIYLRDISPFGFKEFRYDVVGVILKEGEEAVIDLVRDAFYDGEI